MTFNIQYKKLWFYFLLGLFCLAPAFQIFGLQFHSYKFFFFLFPIFLHNHSFSFNKITIRILIALLASTVFFVFHYLLGYQKDETIIIQFSIGFFVLISANSIYNYYEFLKIEETIFSIIFKVFSFNSLFILIFYFFQGSYFTQFFLNFFPDIYLDNELNEFLVRVNGFSSSGGAVLSVIIALVMVLYFTEKVKHTTIDYFLLIVNFFAILIVGRTGLIVLLISILFFLLNGKIKNIKIFILFAITTILFIINFDFFEQSPYLQQTFYRAFEFIVKYQNNGAFGTSSTDKLLGEMFFLPSDDFILWGNGNFGRKSGLQSIESDIMYVRVIFGAGVIGLFFALMPFFVIFILFLNKNYIFRFVLTLTFLLNFKEFFYFGTTGYCQLFFISLIHFLKEKKVGQI
jgi:hypothetical protein